MKELLLGNMNLCDIMILGCDEMKQTDMTKVHEKLTENIEKYINIIVQEYGNYMPTNVLERLKNISDYSQILQIHDYGEVSAYANKNNILMPLCADKILESASKLPGYGINKNHKTYDDKTIVLNDNTFFTYIKHIFISGTNAEGYYDDLLLHETMHFCGSGGATVLKEGINELLTRMLAQKYDLRTNSCGYPKEVKLSYRLMEIFGEETIKQLAFINNKEYEFNFIKEKLGSDAATLYFQVSILAQEEFYNKYYSHMNEFKGISGIAKKIFMYNQINYGKVNKLIDNYLENQVQHIK